MKNTVIEFFQNLPEIKAEQFNKAFELYSQSPMKNPGIERSLNVSGYSEQSLQNLMYDLQKLHGITDVERMPVEKINEKADFRLEILEKVKDLTEPSFLVWLNDAKKSDLNIIELIEFAQSNDDGLALLVLSDISIFKEKVDFIEILVEKTNEEIMSDLENLIPQNVDWEEVLEFAVSVNNEKAIAKIKEVILSLKTPVLTGSNLTVLKDDSLKTENDQLKNENDELKDENQDLNSQKEDLEEENEELKNQIQESKSLPVISAESIRVEFPFLSDKNCPNELKILVADKITVWNEYLVLHEELTKAKSGEIQLSKEDLETKAKRSVECFDENQKIYAELNAFKETGKVLGTHPIFRTLRLTREVEDMTMDEKIKYKNSTSKFMYDNKKKLKTAEKAKDLERIQEINERIAERTERLDLVNKALGVK